MQETSTQPPWAQHYPPGLTWDKIYTPRPLPDMFDQAVATYPKRVCSEFLGRTITYGEMGQLVNRAARGLSDMGIGKDSKVGLLLPNTPTYIIFYYAILKTGACVVNFNPLYTIPELEYQIGDSETDLMVTLDLKLMFDKVETLIEKGVLKRAVIANFSALLPSVKSFLFKMVKGKEDRQMAQIFGRLTKLALLSKLMFNGGEPVNVARLIPLMIWLFCNIPAAQPGFQKGPC